MGNQTKRHEGPIKYISPSRESSVPGSHHVSMSPSRSRRWRRRREGWNGDNPSTPDGQGVRHPPVVACSMRDMPCLGTLAASDRLSRNA